MHGDFHPGNVIRDEHRMVLIDWGDSGVGHPLLDHAAFVERLVARRPHAVVDHWSALWRQTVPGCDPDRARELSRRSLRCSGPRCTRCSSTTSNRASGSITRRTPPQWLARAAPSSKPKRQPRLARHMLIMCPSRPCSASLTASLRVGWACTLRASSLDGEVPLLGQGQLGQQLGDVGADQVAAEQLAVLRVAEQLDEPDGVAEAVRFAVGHERELGDA